MASSSEQARTAAAAPTSAGGDGVVDLLRQLTQQGSHLAEQQVALVKAEVREAADDIKAAVGSMIGAAVIGIAGLGVLLMGLAYLLGEAIDNTPLATVIVGIVTLVIAAVLFAGAKKKMSATNLAPDRTRRTLERTPDAATGHLHTEHRA
jgi:uncharacterized membrane protein YqjE